VNVGSALAFVGIPLQSAYCSSKFACRGFAESVRAELLHEGSHVALRMVHLPAVNTPQFSWCKSVMDRHPMPVPPIYQPEQAAQHILMAATSGSRAAVFGSWNRLVVLAGRFVPGVGNHYAALDAWGSQLTDQPADPNRPSNLHHPVDEDDDHGTHGIFDGQARGVLEPSFLTTLPHAGATVVRAAGQELAERYHSARASIERMVSQRKVRPPAF
jgi:hypothetical protein